MTTSRCERFLFAESTDLLARAVVLCTLMAFAPPLARAADRPSIRSIINSARGDTRLAPGLPAMLTYDSAIPFDAARDSVIIAGQRLTVSDNEDGESLTVRMPAELALGPSSVTVVIGGQSSEPFAILLQSLAPGVGSISRPNRDPLVAGLGCHNAATAGETLTMLAAGLGDPAAARSKITIAVGTGQAQVLEVAESNSFTNVQSGWYSIRFVVPPGEGLKLVSLTIDGETSNYVELPVGKSIRNLSTTGFRSGPAAPGSIATAYRCNGGDLAALRQGEILSADPANLPAELGGTSIRLVDSTGAERTARLYGASRDQVNYLIPPETATGLATVTLRTSAGVAGSADVLIQPVVPSFFYGALQLVRVRGGVQQIEPVSNYTIDIGEGTDEIYLVLFGTGFRLASGAGNMKATVGTSELPIIYAGEQGRFPGLDQLNLRLPATLKGRGLAVLTLTLDGRVAERVQLTFK